MYLNIDKLGLHGSTVSKSLEDGAEYNEHMSLELQAKYSDSNLTIYFSANYFKTSPFGVWGSVSFPPPFRKLTIPNLLNLLY